MSEWWISLGTAGQVFACIAIPATIVLLLQTVLTLIGLGSGHGGDGSDAGSDVDGGDIDSVSDIDTGNDFSDVTDVDFDGDDAGNAVDVNDSNDAHGYDGGLRLFTVRGLVAFLSVMGWVGVICCSSGMHYALAAVIAFVSGIAAMLLLALIMKWLLSLQADGTENIKDALGVSGTVYLRIPHSRSGSGKVNAVIRGKLSEKNAVTDEDTDIEYGEEILVIGISGEETLIVKRKHKI